jgi:hypothetical protein
MPKSTIYDSVIPLIDQSLINEYNDNDGKTFGISDVHQLTRAYEDKINSIKKSQTSLLSLINEKHDKDITVVPKIKFYAGILGIKQAFRDIPWQKDITESFLLWPTKDMIDIDEDFFKWHGSQRFKYNVFLYAIEKHTDRAIQNKAKHSWLKNEKKNLVKVRYLPKGVECKMSFWIYGNKCLFASGGHERIAFTVQSREFSSMMKLLWQNMWNNSKE